MSRPITSQGSTRERSSSTEGRERQQGRRGNKEKDSYSCGCCGLIVMDDDAALECDLCKFWFHCSYQNMSTKLYNTLSEFDGEADGIHWYCRTCNSTAKSMMTMMTTLQTQHTKLEASVSDLKNDMKECKRECTESHSKLEKEIRDCKQECSGVNAQSNTQTKEETSVFFGSVVSRQDGRN